MRGTERGVWPDNEAGECTGVKATQSKQAQWNLLMNNAQAGGSRETNDA